MTDMNDDDRRLAAWLQDGPSRASERMVDAALSHSTGQGWALIAMIFFAVAREGVESVFFLLAVFQQSAGAAAPLGALLGVIVAALLGYGIYVGGVKLDLRRFFIITSLVLLGFASWLLYGGVHDLGEGGVLPESMLLQIGILFAFAVPALWLYLRGNSPKPAQKTA